MNNPLAYTIPAAVAASGLSRTSLYEALRLRKLTALKAGKRTLIPHESLSKFLSSLPEYKAGA
jgi:hypothetical protein